jgi:type II secretory pathway pseudopilin PulG
MASRHSSRGISLIETTIMLLAISILTGMIAPTAKRTIDQARLTRVITDETAIKTAIVNFRTDTAYRGFRTNGSVAEAAAANANGGTVMETLVSDGDIPTCTTTPDLGCGTTTDWKNNATTAAVLTLTDFLERHLVTNNPRATTANNYPTTLWKGAYINAPVDPDPWGNRYAVNVKWFNVNSQCATGALI